MSRLRRLSQAPLFFILLSPATCFADEVTFQTSMTQGCFYTTALCTPSVAPDLTSRFQLTQLEQPWNRGNESSTTGPTLFGYDCRTCSDRSEAAPKTTPAGTLIYDAFPESATLLLFAGGSAGVVAMMRARRKRGSFRRHRLIGRDDRWRRAWRR